MAVPAEQYIDRYALEAELDSGGFGVVYRARHSITGRAVALKLLDSSRAPSWDTVQRFLREARALAAMQSRHVVQVLDAGITDDKRLFLAMELLAGENLARRLRRTGSLTVTEAIALTRQILAGLGAAHACGIVHRDLKPSNVFLAREGEGREVAKVLDFGISRSRTPGDDFITMTGEVLGTPHYMAPEQLRGTRDVDGRADLFAAMVCLYEMLSGALPWEGRGLDEILMQRYDGAHVPLATRLPDADPGLLAVVDRGLARDPDARCRTAEELDRALAALTRDTEFGAACGGDGVPRREQRSTPPPTTRHRRGLPSTPEQAHVRPTQPRSRPSAYPADTAARSARSMESVHSMQFVTTAPAETVRPLQTSSQRIVRAIIGAVLLVVVVGTVSAGMVLFEGAPGAPPPALTSPLPALTSPVAPAPTIPPQSPIAPPRPIAVESTPLSTRSPSVERSTSNASGLPRAPRAPPAARSRQEPITREPSRREGTETP